MSLPTSFFHNQVQFAGGGWGLFFTGDANLSTLGSRKCIRWQHEYGKGFATFFEYSGGGLLYGGTRTVRFANDGTLEATWHSAQQSDSFEPRSFDVWDDGKIIYASENGGNGHFMFTDANGNIQDTIRYYSVNTGNGFIYPFSVEAIQYANLTNDRYYYFGGRLNNGSHMAYQGITSSGVLSGLYATKQATNSDYTAFYPFRTLISYNSSLGNDNVVMIGRHDPNAGVRGYWHSLSAGLSNISWESVHQTNGSGTATAFHGACWHNRAGRVQTNTSGCHHLAGWTTLNNSNYLSTLGKATYNGVSNVTVGLEKSSGTNDGYAYDVEYDHIRTNKVFMVGNHIKLNEAENGYTSYDGYVACFSVTDDGSTAPTLDWCTGIETLKQDGTYADTHIRSVTVDDEGSPIINGSFTDANNRICSFVIKLSPEGITTGSATINNVTVNIYDATSAMTTVAISRNSSALNTINGINWNVQTVTGYKTTGGTNFSDTLVEF